LDPKNKFLSTFLNFLNCLFGSFRIFVSSKIQKTHQRAIFCLLKLGYYRILMVRILCRLKLWRHISDKLQQKTIFFWGPWKFFGKNSFWVIYFIEIFLQIWNQHRIPNILTFIMTCRYFKKKSLLFLVNWTLFSRKRAWNFRENRKSENFCSNLGAKIVNIFAKFSFSRKLVMVFSSQIQYCVFQA
jgi:hypothetical protein